MGNIATVDIPVEKLAAIAALPNVVSVEAARAQRTRLDVSVTGHARRHVAHGHAGQLDGRHAAAASSWASSTTDSTSAIATSARPTARPASWACGTSARAARPGSPPAGFSYGGECSDAMINAAINGDASACTQPSSGGHGTHVGGIAAGTGQATGNGQIGYRMIGMAPDADLLVANSLDKAVSSGAAVLDAIAYMKAKAAALGKPLVVNLSLGSYSGPRDGTSNFERGLDNLSGPGVIIVGAAGNEANAKLARPGRSRRARA